MRGRCLNPADLGYRYYGGRGISVCARWDDFRNFLSDMGERPPGMELDRIDNDRDYEPTNCRWATRQEQLLNRRCIIWVDLRGERICLKEAAKLLGLKYTSVRNSLKRNTPQQVIDHHANGGPLVRGLRGKKLGPNEIVG